MVGDVVGKSLLAGQYEEGEADLAGIGMRIQCYLRMR